MPFFGIMARSISRHDTRLSESAYTVWHRFFSTFWSRLWIGERVVVAPRAHYRGWPW